MTDIAERIAFYKARCSARIPLAHPDSCGRAPASSMIWSPNGRTMVYCEDCIHYQLSHLEADAAEAS